MAVGPDEIVATWAPPPLNTHNGIIVSYSLTCQRDQELSIQATFPSAGSYNLSGFMPATTYNCTVFAATAVGSGPPAAQAVTLLDDGEINAF